MPPLSALNGQIALVTGASHGLGRATARCLATEGVHVIALARTTGALEDLDDEIRGGGGTCTLIPCDLTRLDELEALGPRLAGRFDRLDLWISGAMRLGPLSPIAHSRLSDWKKALDLQVLANVQMIRTLDPLLRAAPAARVVFITDSRADHPGAYWGPYGVAKAAGEELIRTYAAEQGTTRIRVNGFDPGPMDTALRREAFPGEPTGTHPLPETLATEILPLLLPTCAMQGQILRADPSAQ